MAQLKGNVGMDSVETGDQESIKALLAASRSLGAEYDEHIAQQIAAAVQAMVPKAPQPTVAAKDHTVEVVASTLGISLPILGIAAIWHVAHGFYAVLGLDAVVILSTLWRSRR